MGLSWAFVEENHLVSTINSSRRKLAAARLCAVQRRLGFYLILIFLGSVTQGKQAFYQVDEPSSRNYSVLILASSKVPWIHLDLMVRSQAISTMLEVGIRRE